MTQDSSKIGESLRPFLLRPNVLAFVGKSVTRAALNGYFARLTHENQQSRAPHEGDR